MSVSSYRWNVLPLLRSCFEPLLRVYVYLLIILPSGSLFGINVKIICFLLLIVPAFLHLTEDSRVTAPHLGFLLSLPALLAFWIFVSQYNGAELNLAFSESKDILITFVSSWLAAVYFMNNPKVRINFVQMVLHAEVATCVLKVFLLAYSAYAGISVSVIVNSINIFFGVDLMGMDFESSLGRIQLIADGLIPVCIYVLLRYRRRMEISMASAGVMFLLLTVSLIFTFSRYFWAFGVVAFCVGIVFSKKDRFHVFLLALLGIAVAISFPLLASIATLRFSADVAGGSDVARVEQITALEQFFFSAPVLGHGLGSHPKEVTRSVELPYVYEIQLYALAGQVGLLGLGLITLLTMYYFRSLWPWDRDWTTRRFSQRAGLTVLLLVWLMSGLFNPSLLNSAAAMCYALIKALADIPDDKTLLEGYPASAALANGAASV